MQAVTVSATFDDQGYWPPPLTCAVDFGDGSMPVPGTIVGDTCTAGHTYTRYGTYSVTVTVSDLIGTTGTATVDHTVIFPFGGFYPPLSDTNTKKAGSTIPVKFSLGRDAGTGIFLPGSPTVTPCSGGTSVPAVGTLTYDRFSDQYVFTWKTAKTWKGTCQTFTFTLVDGTTHSVDVTFS
jgi:hypothetical protein